MIQDIIVQDLIDFGLFALVMICAIGAVLVFGFLCAMALSKPATPRKFTKENMNANVSVGWRYDENGNQVRELMAFETTVDQVAEAAGFLETTENETEHHDT